MTDGNITNPFEEILNGTPIETENLFDDLPAQPDTPPQPTALPSAVPPSPPQQANPQVIPMPAAPQPELPVQAIPDRNPDDFYAALAKAKTKSEERQADALSEKPAIFSYARAKDPIEDRDCTFEDLRQKYEGDFPELSDDKRVAWTITYGKVTKSVSNPSGERVYDLKSEIEKSKSFLDALKKAKTDAEKNPECLIKPSVRAQNKGDLSLPAYKDLCLTEEDALKSPKTLVLLPSKDGRFYQMRKSEIGTFVAQVNKVAEFEQQTPSFTMALPKIPLELLLQIIHFFADISDEYQVEALAHILYDTTQNKYLVKIPKQKLTACAVNAEIDDYPDRLIHVMDIHSHNTMPAFFSEVDDRDEKATRLYGVIGKLDQFPPEIKLRAGCGGEFIPLLPKDIFDYDASFPSDWKKELEPICSVRNHHPRINIRRGLL